MFCCGAEELKLWAHVPPASIIDEVSVWVEQQSTVMPDENNTESGDGCFGAIRRAADRVKAYWETEQEDPHRNSDGLIIPSSRLFRLLLIVYKIILVVTAILLAVTVIGLIHVATSDEEDEMTAQAGNDWNIMNEISRKIGLLRPYLKYVIAIVVMLTIHNMVGWMGMRTMRLRYLNLDLNMRYFFIILWFIYVISHPITGGSGIVKRSTHKRTTPDEHYVPFVCQAMVMSVIYTIIWKIKMANDSHDPTPAPAAGNARDHDLEQRYWDLGQGTAIPEGSRFTEEGRAGK